MNADVTIQIIDDDASIRTALVALCEFAGWHCLTAASAAEGLEQFQACRPNVVIIDYQMPRINGVEGVRRIRQLSAAVPIIVLTIQDDQKIADAFTKAGANDFAVKPVRAPDLLNRIKLHLKLSQQKPTDRDMLPKGMCRNTLDLIYGFLVNTEEFILVDDIAAGTGLSRQTVYRYLQNMVRSSQVELQSVYSKVGRPKQKFRLKRP